MNAISWRHNGIWLSVLVLLGSGLLVVAEYGLQHSLRQTPVVQIQVQGDREQVTDIVALWPREQDFLAEEPSGRVFSDLQRRYPLSQSKLWLSVARALLMAGRYQDVQRVLDALSEREEILSENDDRERLFLQARLLAALGDNDTAVTGNAVNAVIEEAITAYRALLQRWPNHQPGQINLGLLLARTGHHDQAVVALDRAAAISRGERKAKSLAAKSDSLMVLQRYSEAEAGYRDSIQYRPDHAVTWRKLAEAQRLQGEDSTRVTATLDKALALEPDYARALHDRARVLWLAARLDQSLETLQQLRQVAPDYLPGRWTLLHLSLYLEKSQLAANEIHWLRQQRPDAQQPLLQSSLQPSLQSSIRHAFLQGLSLVVENRWPEASDIFSTLVTPAEEQQSALADQREWVQYYNALGRYYGDPNTNQTPNLDETLNLNETGPLQLAQRQLRPLFDHPWLGTVSQMASAAIYRDAENFQQAIDVLFDLHKQFPGSHRVAYLLGRNLYDDGQYSRAVSQFITACDAAPDNSRYRLGLALAQTRAGNGQAAEQSYRALLARFPGHKTAHYNYAVLLNRQERIHEAIDHYHKVLAVDAGYAKALINLSLIYRKQDDLQKAQHYLQELTEYHPAHRRGRELLARTHWELGQADLALNEINRLLTLEPERFSTQLLKADIFAGQDRLQEAVELLLSISPGQDPDQVMTKLYNIGVVALRKNDMGLAEFCNRQVLARDPARDDTLAGNTPVDKALVNLSSMLNREARFQESLALLPMETLARFDNPKLVVNRAAAHQGLGEHQQVIALLNPQEQDGVLSGEGQAILQQSRQFLRAANGDR